ncbi:hypothetical protein B0A48_16248 [Cryoendolithus antarcticus]|uniref:Uncharacterized protein n=1 Tax=Cryoendolithus antarcticus TaxID=1507870 RepID=A0A1V8SFL4_9PEZI|nr:hypothetical protein B0A48_16248 [Cryoendolithus antarcticus]
MAKVTARKRKPYVVPATRPRIGGKSIATLERIFPGLEVQAAASLPTTTIRTDRTPCTTGLKADTFRCAACPLEAADHFLCLPTHPCLWNNPIIAHRAHAQRRIWLKQPPTKLCNGRASRAYGRMVDENGVEEVRMMVVPPGQKPWDAWNVYVEKLYALLMLPGERGERASRGVWEEDRDRRGRWLDEL